MNLWSHRIIYNGSVINGVQYIEEKNIKNKYYQRSQDFAKRIALKETLININANLSQIISRDLVDYPRRAQVQPRVQNTFTNSLAGARSSRPFCGPRRQDVQNARLSNTRRPTRTALPTHNEATLFSDAIHEPPQRREKNSRLKLLPACLPFLIYNPSHRNLARWRHFLGYHQAQQASHDRY